MPVTIDDHEWEQLQQLARQQQEQVTARTREVNSEAAQIAEQGIALYGRNRWERAVNNIKEAAKDGDLTGFNDWARGRNNPVEVIMTLGEDPDRLREFKDADRLRQDAIGASISHRVSSYGHGDVGSQPSWKNATMSASQFVKTGGVDIPPGEAGDKLWNKLFDESRAMAASLRKSRGY